MSLRDSCQEGTWQCFSGSIRTVFTRRWNSSRTQSMMRMMRWGGRPRVRTVAMSDGLMVCARGNSSRRYEMRNGLSKIKTWPETPFGTVAVFRGGCTNQVDSSAKMLYHSCTTLFVVSFSVGNRRQIQNTEYRMHNNIGCSFSVGKRGEIQKFMKNTECVETNADILSQLPSTLYCVVQLSSWDVVKSIWNDWKGPSGYYSKYIVASCISYVFTGSHTEVCTHTQTSTHPHLSMAFCNYSVLWLWEAHMNPSRVHVWGTRCTLPQSITMVRKEPFGTCVSLLCDTKHHKPLIATHTWLIKEL